MRRPLSLPRIFVRAFALGLAVALAACTANAPAPSDEQAAVQDPLPSWNDSPSKQAIVGFVRRVTTPGAPEFVPEAERIATFDNDGTLWAEQPVYFQLAFAIDRVKATAPEHPEWKTTQPFKAVIENDRDALMAAGTHGILELMMATHTGMTTEAFEGIVKDWLATARHPRFNRPYTELVFQPMLEVLAYLRANGFKTFIVSGGGLEFMRAFSDRVYGIPPEQAVGSSVETAYEVRDGRGVLVQQPKLFFIDDGPGKPVAINRHIGRRPIAVFGNSDGDFEMLEYATTGEGPRLGVLVHHTDADREWAYDRDSSIGHLERGLDEAAGKGWVVVSMKDDWKRVFAFE